VRDLNAIVRLHFYDDAPTVAHIDDGERHELSDKNKINKMKNELPTNQTLN
jgi:hypothetical protein